MRRTKLVAAVLVAVGLLFGASGTAMAVGGENTPEATPAEAVPTARTDEGDAPQTTVPREKRPADPAPRARPARPVPGDPSFTG